MNKGAFSALLVTVNVPSASPSTAGVNRSVIETDSFGYSLRAPPFISMVNTPGLLTVDAMFNGSVPVLEISATASCDDPTFTFPKSTVAGPEISTLLPESSGGIHVP